MDAMMSFLIEPEWMPPQCRSHHHSGQRPQSEGECPMKSNCRNALIAIALTGLSQPASADVITDWNDRAVAYVLSRGMGPPPAERIIAMVHVAMFDAINSIERRYRPYMSQLPATATTSKEAAAAAAAGTVLASIHPQTQADMKAALATYLANIPDSAEKTMGIKLGEAVAAKVLEARTNDGSSAPDSYRPKSKVGVYVSTAPTVAPQWPGVKPFAMTSGSQFRPEGPVALTSKEWTVDYNEIKDLGGHNSSKRSAQQSENARFWLASGGNIYYPVVRGIHESKKLNLIEGARLYALMAVARADALIAVFDAKYHYDFWRPVTAIRNGDMDDNPATERDATWTPIAETPMHPEYPCAHCTLAGSMTGVVEALFGTPDVRVSTTSPTLTGVTHSWTNMRALDTEVAEARIWAGFHYRFSVRVGQNMGRKIGEHTVKSVMQPVAVATR
jgi:hypothetical protein